MDIEKLTKEDIGIPVVYKKGLRDQEMGIITSFNKSYIFVKYEGDLQSKATNPWDLQYQVKGE